MLSRIAEYHFWMGRYIERAENTARMVLDNYQTQLDAKEDETRWGLILDIFGEGEEYQKRYSEEIVAGKVEQFLTLDLTNRSSILSCITQARENARGIRDQISSEVWLTLNRLYLDLRQLQWEGLGDAKAIDFYEKVKEYSQLIHGLLHNTLLHGAGWNFIRAGRFIERAALVVRLLQIRYQAYNPEGIDRPNNLQEWYSVLRSVSAFEVYCKLHHATVTPRNVVDLLVFHPKFPRSLHYAASHLYRSLESIHKERLCTSMGSAADDKALRLAGKLLSNLEYGSLDEVYEMGVVAYLKDFEQKLYPISNLINQQYFWYQQPLQTTPAPTIQVQKTLQSSPAKALQV
jgi:uncharacterized alpha-E superfamily protein